jgi:hypothetical protein
VICSSAITFCVQFTSVSHDAGQPEGLRAYNTVASQGIPEENLLDFWLSVAQVAEALPKLSALEVPQRRSAGNSRGVEPDRELTPFQTSTHWRMSNLRFIAIIGFSIPSATSCWAHPDMCRLRLHRTPTAHVSSTELSITCLMGGAWERAYEAGRVHHWSAQPSALMCTVTFTKPLDWQLKAFCPTQKSICSRRTFAQLGMALAAQTCDWHISQAL